MKKIVIAFAIIAALTSCRSRVYEYDDGEWQRKSADEETATVIIVIE